MSKAQDSVERVKNMARKTTDFTSYVMSPILIGFMAIAEPFISLLLTDKWLPCVPYLRISCIILLFRAPQTAILQAIKAVGRSDVVLKVDIPIRVFAIAILVISLRHSVLIFALSEIVVTVFGTILYIIASQKIINYSGLEVAGDFLINIILAVIMGIVVWSLQIVIPMHAILLMFIQIIVGGLVYILLSVVTKSKSFYDIRNMVRSYLAKIRKVK